MATTATVKPGWQTSEFWLTSLHQIASVAILLHVLPAADAAAVDGSLTQLIPAVFVVIAQALGLYGYVHSRMTVKTTSTEVPPPSPPVVIDAPKATDVIVNSTGDGKLLK